MSSEAGLLHPGHQGGCRAEQRPKDKLEVTRTEEGVTGVSQEQKENNPEKPEFTQEGHGWHRTKDWLIKSFLKADLGLWGGGRGKPGEALAWRGG